MRRLFSQHRIALLFGMLTFGLGAYSDFYLRANKGPTCFGCYNRICYIVEYIDNPRIVISHPVQAVEDFIFIK